MNEILQGDCLEIMKSFPDNYFSGIVTDPPYGLEFMNKRWDYAVPEVSCWKEAIRIAKPGSFLISMGGTRTFHRLCCAIEDAGFEIRDCISWLYGSGFPKSHNHFGADGYGTALKPAWEPCILAMKPLDGTFANNYLKWGVGGLNIDGCRIGTEEIKWKPRGTSVSYAPTTFDISRIGEVNKGRWPANLLLDSESAAMLDEQSGVLKNGGQNNSSVKGCGMFMEGSNRGSSSFAGDSGGASRFFYCAKTSTRERNEGLDLLPSVECQTGCGGTMPIDDQGKERDPFKTITKNFHPTVKPLALMRYLITLISPSTNALILDPFAGSGSTIVAAEQLHIKAIGIEKQPEYVEIARARVLHAAKKASEVAEQMSLF